MALISIIIPVYNAEPYLRQTLDSICCQEFVSKCEVLLINDGSTDSSLEILQDYSRRYSNIRIIDKPNEGVSATRNIGISEATGDYIFFMDADDLLHPDAMDFIVRELEDKCPDILTWTFSSFYRKAKFAKFHSRPKAIPLTGSHEMAFNHLMQKGIAVSLCTKAIRRSIFGQYIQFDSSMTYGEDMFLSWKCILLAESISLMDIPLYYYRQTGSSAVSRFHANLYEKYKNAFDDMKDFAKQHDILDDQMINDISYHFARRIPALIGMEARASYGKEEKMNRIATILENPDIKKALSSDNRLIGEIFDLARDRNVSKLLKCAKIDSIKTRLLFPIKRLLK